MIVEDLLNKSDEELLAMLKSIRHEAIDWTPVILAELTRRNVVRLRDETQHLRQSSNRIEKLTWALIALTIVLAVFALPPAFEIAQRWLVSRQDVTTPPKRTQTQPEARQALVQDLSGLSNEDLFFLGASENRHRFNTDKISQLKNRQPHVGDTFEADGKHWVVSRILKDGTLAADEHNEK